MYARRPTSHQQMTAPIASPSGDVLRDAQGYEWTAADFALAADRAVAHLTRQVLPAFDASDPRRGV
ncbi:hypothetical protein DSM104329_02463 [Capillimicrobium parvum]|uniref:Uncharacterized protein n=2 Tax=Capillimicrobium parvum TaxID=2884022 RepID=A0A9E6XX89_9ACTN|nr:hypothetical protein DSM104329_02463 [Capillimicrobium parvum]